MNKREISTVGWLRARGFTRVVLLLLSLAVFISLVFIVTSEYSRNHPIEWTPFSSRTLGTKLGEGHTVLVLVYAEWDMASDVVLNKVFETRQVRRAVWSGGIVTLKADYTGPVDPDTIAWLGPRYTTPVVTIYPARNPDNAIVLEGFDITENQVVAALAQARKARPASAVRPRT